MHYCVGVLHICGWTVYYYVYVCVCVVYTVYEYICVVASGGGILQCDVCV